MPRLTRAESQARTRELLLETARRLFLDEGYSATSIAKVADTAGFSSGAVYSNFESKAELALAVLEQIQDEVVGQVTTIMAGTDGFEDTLVAIEVWGDEVMASGWPRLELEFALEARRDPALVRALADRERSVADLIATALHRHLVTLGLAEVLPAKALARAAISLAIGLAIQHLVDPSVTAQGLTEPLRRLLGVTAAR
ncbi:TetR/AcrR family transcriptional regulator [Kutzneria viridogrisea]|uniref:HTH tetR-type domain-containing protein n=2 Tax=Kutzneria TaxID=43356 RepID=W5W5R7_9PSEU|nr:TetR/AcrR family transcriptional regulator [Kutzneria albida]AHH96563.1 hypothetical protein KALB_3196 [Kutzneria albida DSM 43870]MBA8928217.1 AcrR family transcriptional regulator [Kutzneria viridogrisea]